jgi:uncharacterized protein YeeX (DUF496 family)
MTFEEIKPLIDKLSVEDIQRLNDYLQPKIHNAVLPLDMDALLAAVDMIREGLSEAELDEMITLMNEEYIEEVDDSL